MAFVTGSYTITHRDGTVVAENIPMQIEEIGLQEASIVNSQSPFDTYQALVNGLYPDMMAGDSIVSNQGDLDPVTGQLPRYRVQGRPMLYPLDNHMELYIVMYRGK